MPLISAQDLRGYFPAANDGIIATAGVIESLVVAGAGTDVLFAAAFASTVAGASAFAALKFSEAAADRDAQLAVVEQERRELARSPEAELEELAAHYEARGVDPALARQVARQVSAHDALGAQLESEHGIREIAPIYAPLLAAIGGALAFMLGAALPVAVVILAPPEWRGVGTAVAVFLALALTATLSARLCRASLWRSLARSVLVGAVALLLSALAGSFLPDPDGAAVASTPPAAFASGVP